MKFTEEMRLDLDVDWFGIDLFGQIFHVASMQGKLPDSVAESVEDNSLLISYIGALDNKYCQYNLDDAGRIMKSQGLRMDNYIFYAQRGLFSFDKSNINNPDDSNYDRIAIPTNPIIYKDLSLEIQKIVGRTLFKGDISKVSNFNVDEMVL